MANYIKNEILCEAYSHLDVQIAHDPIALAELKEEMSNFFMQRAKFLFGEDVTVAIEFEQGSLVTKLKVLGNASLILIAAINGYGTFRQSVEYLAKDSTLLAQSANLEMVFRTRATFCDRVRIEKRRGVFGRIDELLSELDSIRRTVEEQAMPRSAVALTNFEKGTTDRVLDWNERVGKLFSKLDHDETKACVAAGMLEELERFPSTLPWTRELNNNSFKTSLVTTDPKLVGLLEGAAVRFNRTVIAIRKDYETTVKQYAPKTT